MTTIIERLLNALDGQELSPFVNPSHWEAPGTDGTKSENYGTASEGRARSYLQLEASNSDAEVLAGIDGILSARPPGYDDVNQARNLLNEFETDDYPESDTIENIIDDPLVGQPLPETIDLYIHAQAEIRGSMEVTGFAYLNLDVSSLESTLSGDLEEPVLYGLSAENFQADDLDDSDLIELLIAGLVDIPISATASIAQPATTPGGSTNWAGFAVCTTNGPVDPLHVYAEDQAFFDLISGFGRGDWPLFDTADKTAALQLTEQTILPMAVLEALRDTHDLSYFEWRAVGNNQKDLFTAQLRRLANRTPTTDLGPDEPVFAFDLLDWQNLFQLEAVTEFYANFHQPWAQTPIEQTQNLTGTNASVSGTGTSWKRAISLDGSPDLSSVVANKDVIQFDEEVDRSEQAFLIVNIDDDANEIEVHGTPDFGNSPDSQWRIPTETTVNFLNPAGDEADITHGSDVVDLSVDAPSHYRENLRWLWLLHENLLDTLEESSPDWTDVVPWMPDTIRFDALPGDAFRITDVDIENLTLTVARDVELPEGEGSETTGWGISRRTRLVLIDPLGGRLSGREATVNDQNSQQVQLDGPAPDLTRINYNFDTLYLPDDNGGRAYRIMKTPRTHDIPDGHVELHAEPNLENGSSTWSLGAGVGAGQLPPLYYDVGQGQRESYDDDGNVNGIHEFGYDHHDGGMFVVRDGGVKNWFRWNSYSGRIVRVDKSDNWFRSYESSVRGNARYEFLSWWSSKPHLNHCFRVYDQLSRHYMPKRMASNTIDTVREAGFFFQQEDGWTTEFTDREVQSVWDEVTADRASPTQEHAGEGTDDGKTAIRLHWSPHYRPGDNARSAGCITSPAFASFRETLCRIHLNEHNLVFEEDGDWDADREPVEAMLNNEVYETRTRQRFWRDRLGGVFWLIHPDQRPMEEL